MFRTNLIRIACVTLACGVLAPALATESPTLTFSKPTNRYHRDVTVRINPGDDATATIPGKDDNPPPDPNDLTAEHKRSLIAAALRAKGYTVVEGPNTDEGLAGNQLKIKYLRNGTEVHFQPNGTGEVEDDVLAAAAVQGSIGFGGLFEPLDPNGIPAVFTAGIVTDVGELTAQVSAEELNFQTDGPIICQALFERLAPQAPPYGVQILLSDTDSRLDVYFDPAYTVESGGVRFGTSSLSEGCSGAVVSAGSSCIEDLNGDGVVDLADLAEMLAAYGSSEEDPGYNQRADLDGNGVIDLSDLAAVLAAYGQVCGT